MSGTTINISGNSNDTNLVLGSANASISDNASASVPIDSINPPVTLKINNTYWGSGSYEYEKLLEFINRVDRSSGGMIKMELVGNTGPSAIPELFPKLQSGEYDGFVLPTKALTDFFQKNKVYELIGEPAAGAGLGYDYTLFSSWLETGGGYELLDQVTASDNFKMFPIMNVSPEGGGWFSKQISSLADLTSTTNQVVYRSPGGTVGRAYQAIDISVNLTLGSTSDVVAGFESGIINAGEWAGIFPDVCFNFHTYAPYAMVGGVHQNIAITTFNLSTAALAKLTSSQQELIKNLCRDEFNNTPGKRIEKNGKLLKNLVDAGSVTLMETPQDFIDAFRSAVKTIYESDKSGNTLFTTVYNSLETFMENNKDFRRLELDAMAKLSRSPVPVDTDISLNIIDMTGGFILNTEGKDGIKLAAKNVNMDISYTAGIKYFFNDVSYADGILAPSYYFAYEKRDYFYLTTSPAIRLDSQGFLKWSQTSEGKNIINEIFNDSGYHPILYGDTGIQNQIWTDFSINSVTDFSGKIMTGVGQFGDWLESHNAIEGDKEDLSVNLLEHLGKFQDTALASFSKMTHNYINFPTEPRATFYLLIKNSVWNKLSLTQKTVLESACLTNYGSMQNIIKNVNDFYYDNVHKSTWLEDASHSEVAIPDDVKTSYYTYSKDILTQDSSNNSSSTTFSKLITSLRTFSLNNPEYVIDPSFISY